MFYNNMFAKFVVMITLASLLTMLNNRLLESSVLKYVIYGLMTYSVYYVVSYTYKIKPLLSR